MNIIGCIKLDTSNPERIKWFFASLMALGVGHQYSMAIDGDDEFKNKFMPAGCEADWITKFSKDRLFHVFDKEYSYGQHQSANIKLLHKLYPNNKYTLNFEEDHFYVQENDNSLEQLLLTCNCFNVDVIRASFIQVENLSTDAVKLMHEDEYCRIFRMNKDNHELFQHKWPRFYLGTNCIFRNEYAVKFYNKPGVRPHDYELPDYSSGMEYICCVPKFEILRSIDDDHDMPNSCMLKDKTDKWITFYDQASKFVNQVLGIKEEQLPEIASPLSPEPENPIP